MQTGSCAENVVYARASGEAGILLSVSIKNVSGRVIRLVGFRLEIPVPHPDFHWLKEPSAEELRRWGGYVLAACGPYGFDESTVLNHRFGRNSALLPGDEIEGFLLGEGTMSIPTHYADREVIPMQLVVCAGGRDSYGAWLKLAVSRERQRPTNELGEEQRQTKTLRAEKAIQ